ncbi:MAG: type II toxin-antitoxin system RelE/ParE family toxin [Gammaproteobacteria bacterium]|nr:type II toxin-antitoxin system RelE/ParE family toxin [Gammaproteobacteria bacterium]MCH9743585.1 type II toxin-antitoxin system RelE/ParE family toxin [Gammaproteobacteria bacterium]
MRIFKTRYFNRWAKAEGLLDERLVFAVSELSSGLYEGDLGSACYKKRIGIMGRGKRGGVRVIIAYEFDNKSFFIYGYAKNVRTNINEKEKIQFRKLSKTFLSLGETKINKLLKLGELIEVEK